MNNITFPNVGMPHVLEGLQRDPEPVYDTQTIDGEEHKVVVGTQVSKMGELTSEEYDNTVRDLVNF